MFTALFIAVIAVFAYAFIRLHQVSDYRIKLIDRISELTKRDIYNYDVDAEPVRSLLWRYKEFDKVSFDDMVFSFKTISAENYWEDTSFLK